MHTPYTTAASLTEIERLELISKMKKEDPTVIPKLYQLYSRVVYRIALKIVKSEDLAASVLQDTFCKIWKYSSRYDPQKGGIFTWVINIARNTAIDTTRKRSYKQQKSGHTLGLEYVIHQPGQDNTTMDSIGMADVLKKMKEKHLTLLEKYYYQGCTHSEIVEDLGLPLGTVKTRLRGAILELRSHLSHDLRVHQAS